MWLRFDTINDDVYKKWDYHTANNKRRIIESAYASRNRRYTQEKERHIDRQTKIIKKIQGSFKLKIKNLIGVILLMEGIFLCCYR